MDLSIDVAVGEEIERDETGSRFIVKLFLESSEKIGPQSIAEMILPNHESFSCHQPSSTDLKAMKVGKEELELEIENTSTIIPSYLSPAHSDVMSVWIPAKFTPWVKYGIIEVEICRPSSSSALK